jgi:GR25 family glycosyltransferase involved in LPS biosynthesis
MNSMELWDLPCKVINLDRNPERWSTCQARLKEAGFSNFERVSAVDALDKDALAAAWNELGNPLFASWDTEFVSYPGKQGCFLSHVRLWKEMVDKGIEQMVVFEDDVLFHKDWLQLAPQYCKSTPKDFEVLYLGAQFEFTSTHHIDRGPVFCTHAMVLTLGGVKKLLKLILEKPGGVYTIDCMLIDYMKDYCRRYRFNRNTDLPFVWYVWNGFARIEMPNGWTKRNCGLVYQDEAFGSEVRPW